jgi:LysM repeat protein
VYHDDDARGECFRSYPHPEDSYRDHSDFLKNRPYYAALFTLDPTDYVAWSNGLRKAGYATNPKYAQILIKLIEDYQLEQYTLIAMGKEKASEEVVLQAPGAVSMPLKDSVRRVHPDAGAYPEGEFMINKARVIYAKAGTSLLAIADQYGIALPKLLDFNDLKEEDVLEDDQLVFLQRKRKVGGSGFHIVREGETLYDICQSEGVRYQDLLEMNHLVSGDEPAAGEKVYLQGKAPGRPALEKQ